MHGSWQGSCHNSPPMIPNQDPLPTVNRKQMTHLDHTGMNDLHKHTVWHTHKKHRCTKLPQSIHDETWQQMLAETPTGKILSRWSQQATTTVLPSLHHLWQYRKISDQSETWTTTKQTAAKEKPANKHL